MHVSNTTVTCSMSNVKSYCVKWVKLNKRMLFLSSTAALIMQGPNLYSLREMIYLERGHWQQWNILRDVFRKAFATRFSLKNASFISQDSIYRRGHACYGQFKYTTWPMQTRCQLCRACDVRITIPGAKRINGYLRLPASALIFWMQMCTWTWSANSDVQVKLVVSNIWAPTIFSELSNNQRVKKLIGSKLNVTIHKKILARSKGSYNKQIIFTLASEK